MALAWLKEYTPTMTASAGAGFLARVPLHPLDTCKARLQVQSASQRVYSGVASVLLQTVRTEGVRGLYRGFGVAALGSVPASCIYFTTYELSRDAMLASDLTRAHPSLCHLAGGLAAEAVACILYVPIDVLKERMQVQRDGASGSYRNGADALRTVLRFEGLRGVYKGYWATVGSFGPFSALYFMFYEQLKRLSLQLAETPEGNDLPFVMTMMSGAGAGGAAALLTSPLDMAKLRLQVQLASSGRVAEAGARVAATDFRYRGMVHGLTQIVRHEGFAALFKGAGARVAFFAPSSALSIAFFEKLKTYFSGG